MNTEMYDYMELHNDNWAILKMFIAIIAIRGDAIIVAILQSNTKGYGIIQHARIRIRIYH